jgi:hypothetical protein
MLPDFLLSKVQASFVERDFGYFFKRNQLFMFAFDEEKSSFHNDSVIIMHVLHQSYDTILSWSYEERTFYKEAAIELLKKLNSTEK